MEKRAALIFFLLLLCASATAQTIDAQQGTGQNTVTVYFFWREGCPYCAKEDEFLKGLEAKYPELEVHYLLTSENRPLFEKLAAKNGATTQWVPALFIEGCDFYRVGFNDQIGMEIEAQINEMISEINNPTCQDERYITVPIIGKVDLQNISLPIFTVAIAGLDGLNPCAIWVLMFLLSLLIYAKSRRKILFIGGLFVAVSGIIYFLFMAAWLNIFLFIGYTDIMRALIAVIALAFGIINMKDFFFFKKGVSLTIPDSAKPKLFEKMRKLVQEEATITTVAGVIVLAIFVNLIELACTLGLPAIYTRILTLQKIPPVQYYLYLALYNLIYVVPLAIIVSIFAFTLGGRKLTEKQGRVLKLVSGALMLALGLIMFFRPELLSFA
ncbi:MAG: glutaredoxin [Candidatus Diapherotrites archaeon]|nr:glutaredoxin [Candidatus Diapherotrites archaeon]